jgi:hypothetical protein
MRFMRRIESIVRSFDWRPCLPGDLWEAPEENPVKGALLEIQSSSRMSVAHPMQGIHPVHSGDRMILKP